MRHVFGATPSHVQAARWSWAALPVVVALARVALEGTPSAWANITVAGWWTVGADILLVDSGILVLAAPICGVLAACETSGRPTPATSLLAYLAVALLVTLATMTWVPGTLTNLLAAHAVMASAALALAGLGWCAAQVLTHPLDATAFAVALSFIVSVGVLISGPWIQAWPPGLINGALLVSPVVSVAAAVDLDLLRLPLLYQLSPLAHRAFEYPTPGVAMSTYLFCSVLCFGAARFLRRLGFTKG